MRISSLGAVLFLAACGSPPQGSETEGERIACALDGSAEFTPLCSVERVDEGIVIHHPDGSFRRFELLAESVEALDGADVVRVVRLADGHLEVAVAHDRYRLKLPDPGYAPRS